MEEGLTFQFCFSMSFISPVFSLPLSSTICTGWTGLVALFVIDSSFRRCVNMRNLCLQTNLFFFCSQTFRFFGCLSTNKASRSLEMLACRNSTVGTVNLKVVCQVGECHAPTDTGGLSLGFLRGIQEGDYRL